MFSIVMCGKQGAELFTYDTTSGEQALLVECPAKSMSCSALSTGIISRMLNLVTIQRMTCSIIVRIVSKGVLFSDEAHNGRWLNSIKPLSL